MIRDGGVGRIEYAEVTKLGQKGEFGRYPLHVITLSFSLIHIIIIFIITSSTILAPNQTVT